MDEFNKMIDLAINEFKKEYGTDSKLEEGDEFITIFNNCSLILGVEDNELKIKLVGGNPYRVDYTCSFFIDD